MHYSMTALLTIGALTTQVRAAVLAYPYLSASIYNPSPNNVAMGCNGNAAQCSDTPVYYIVDQLDNNPAYGRAQDAIVSAANAVAKTLYPQAAIVTAVPAAAVSSRIPSSQWMVYTSVQNKLQSLQSNLDTTGAGYKAKATATGSTTSAASISGSSGASSASGSSSASSASGSASATPSSGSAASATGTTGPSAASSARSSGAASRATGAAIGAVVGAVAGLAYAL